MSRRVLSALAVAAVLTGSSCGVAGTDFRPGVAAQVGDERIYTADVDSAADSACSFITEQAASAGEPDPADPAAGGEAPQKFQRSALRAELMQLLVQRAAVDQLLEENDLEVGSDYDAQLAEVEKQLTTQGTEEETEGLRTGNEASLFVQSGLVVLGTELLSQEGQQVDPTQPDAAGARGVQELSQWLLDNDVELNPVYGLSIDDDGVLTSESDETSVVVSQEARFGMVAEPAASDAEPDAEQQEFLEDQQDYIDALPASQTCG